MVRDACSQELSARRRNAQGARQVMVRPSRETIGDRSRTHGYSRSSTYKTWEAMLTRCNNADQKTFAAYGARGITVCKRWLKFENFLADMGERPSGKTIDRYPDKNGNYEPTNCRWATQIEQCRNRNTCRTVERSDGLIFQSIIEAAEFSGANKRGIWDCCNGRQNFHRGFSWRYLP